jgi:DHA1 family multidrug resistance protein B-like MFS transporter
MTLDATDEKDRKFVYGLQYWLHNLAFLCGSLVGGLLFLEYKFLLMMMMAIGAVLSWCLLKFFIKELYAGTEPKHNMVKNYLAILKDRRFVFFSLGAAFLGSVEFQVRNYLAVKCAAEGSLFNYTLLISENTLLVVLLGIVSSYLIKNTNHRKVLYIGGSVLIVAMSLMAGFSHCLWILILLMAIATMGELVMVPSEQALMADMIPSDARSSYMAIGNVFCRLGIMFGSLSVTIGHFLTHWQMVGLFMSVGFGGLLLITLSYKQKVME